MKRIIACLIILLITATGCKQEAPDIGGAYITVIDKLYNEDSALNSDIKYVAIDTSLINNLNDEQKSSLLKDLERYGYTVLDMTFEELEAQGYIEDLFFKEGILFKIEDESVGNKSIIMDASKWRSGLGSIGYDDLKIEYKNGKWEVTSTGNAWIS